MKTFVDFPNCREVDGSPVRAFDFEVSLETRLVDVVRPCNSFGAKGPEICTAWTELTGETV